MTKNPIINSLTALLYILAVAVFFYLANHFLSHTPDNSFLAPIAMLSLFTLSAGVMGYIFLSQPLQLYFDGKKKEAVNLFIKTLMAFGAITFVVLALLFSRILG